MTPRKILLFDVENIEYLPLVRAIVEQGFTPIMNSTTLRTVVEKSGLPCEKWEAFAPSDLGATVQSQTIRIASEFSVQLRQNHGTEVFASPAGSFLSKTGDHFARTLVKFVSDEIVTIETLRCLLSTEAVSLIVMGCDNSHVERALVLYATQQGIKTLQLAHGINANHFNERIAADMYTLFSDYVAVFGKHSWTDLVGAGNDPERIFVTGSVPWDRLYSADARLARDVARKRLGLRPEDPVILYCSSYAEGVSAFYPAHAQRLFELFTQVTQAARQCHPRAQLLVRPHPNELRRATSSVSVQQQLDNLFQQWLGEAGLGQSVRLVRDKKIEAIRSADVIVTVATSTVNYEAMILERPVVSLPWFYQKGAPVREEKGITIVEDPSTLSETLSDMITNPDSKYAKIARQNEALKEINHESDGQATQRVTELICALAGPNTPQKTKFQSLAQIA